MDIATIEDTMRLMNNYRYFKWLNSPIDDKRDALIDTKNRIVEDIVDIEQRWYLDAFEL